MTSHSTAIYTPFADGRTVRDIVEHSPALVTEAWCRQLLRQVLQSLEQQYASGAPHRPITPDSIVMLDSGEALLLSLPDTPGNAGEANLAADLHALALVIHYAISAELPPEGPLGPRLYDDYSDNLTQTIDRCLGPNQRLRPKSIAELRTMLGFEQEAMAEPAPAAVQAVAATVGPGEQAMPDMPGLRAVPAPGERAPEPPAQPQPREQEAPAVTAAPLPHEDREPAPDPFSRPALAATPLKPSSHPAQEAVPNPPAFTQASAPRARSGLERWAMIAGAAVVLLAAGGALYTHLNQDNAADLVALSLPPQEHAARGLDASETVVAPAAEAANPDGAVGASTGAPAPATDPAGAAALPAGANATAPNGAAAGAGRQADAVVNGTTYKLLIKPWGTIYVNGIDRGVSPPVKRLTLGQGQHTIRIVNPNFAEHVMTVTAGDAENATIEHDFTAQAEGGR